MAEGLIPRSAPRGRRTRRVLAGALLAIAVATVHGCIVEAVDAYRESREAQRRMPARIEVSYVRDMALEAPPAVVTAATPAVKQPAKNVSRPAAVTPAASTASMPEPAASAPDAAPSAPAVEPPAVTADASTLAASGPSSVDTFAWPESTRLSYVLTGNYQGEVHGNAQVEWVRVGSQYQMHLDVTVGLPFAPLLTRRMSSEGDITEVGLAPRRYDQFTKLAFRNPWSAGLRFDPDEVVLTNGQRRARVPGLQDSVSQFVQLAWMFGLHPERLQPGRTVEVPLALPRNLDLWVYDVVEEETLYTRFGALQAVRVKPRREARAGGDLVAEIWFAPQLRHLPVRIRIHQDADTFIDLLLAKRPELAAR
jgi:hypothetical protein